MNWAVEFAQVSFTYPDGTAALRDITFQMSQGECAGLVGPSGAGKSTLALHLVGFLFPQAGKVKVAGLELHPKNLAAIRRKVGLIFQNPDDQLFMPTLYDDVAFGLLQRRLNGEELDRRVKEALAACGLAGLEHKFPGHLSAGQKRLAALAAVLVLEPEILILDEPSSNLDPRARRQLINQLLTLPGTRIIASHDLEMILDLCSRVLLLDHGRIYAEGDPSSILGDHVLMAAHGLEVPHSLLPHRHHHVPLWRRGTTPADNSFPDAEDDPEK